MADLSSSCHYYPLYLLPFWSQHTMIAQIIVDIIIYNLLTKIITNRAILTKLWPSEFWHGNGKFEHLILLGHNFINTYFSPIFLSIFVDWDLLCHRLNFYAQKQSRRHSVLLCPEGLQWWCCWRCCHPCGFVVCVFSLCKFVSVEF